MTSWVQVQSLCEERLTALQKTKKEGKYRDLKNLLSLIDANEDMRKLAISAQGKKYEGRYIKG